MDERLRWQLDVDRMWLSLDTIPASVRRLRLELKEGGGVLWPKGRPRLAGFGLARKQITRFGPASCAARGGLAATKAPVRWEVISRHASNTPKQTTGELEEVHVQPFVNHATN